VSDVEEVIARFIVRGRFDANRLTDLAGVKPDQTWHRGEEIPHTARHRSDDAWIIEARDGSAQDELDALLGNVEKFAGSLPPGVQLEFIVSVWTSFGTGPGVSLLPHVLARIVAIGATLSVETYCVSD
jgi:hypothetical protein